MTAGLLGVVIRSTRNRPGGVEGFFRDAGKPAAFRGLPPVGEQFLDKEALKEIGARYSQEFVGPPLPPKD